MEGSIEGRSDGVSDGISDGCDEGGSEGRASIRWNSSFLCNSMPPATPRMHTAPTDTTSEPPIMASLVFE